MTTKIRLALIAYTLLCLGINPVYGDDYAHLSGAGNNPRLDRVSFTDTQKWGKDFLAFTRKRTRYLPAAWQKNFAVPAPPANTSPRTNAELEHLVKLASQRSSKASEIRAEVLVTNFRWGKHTYQQLTDANRFKHTSRVMEAAYHELAVAVFVFKQRFNRVRPSVLGKGTGKDFGHAIDIPTHPAYPSGHATGAFTMAYILQELDPENAEQYRTDALRIAHNREIAGLHYPSDTEAGRLLARQIADALLANKKFQTLLKAARSEW